MIQVFVQEKSLTDTKLFAQAQNQFYNPLHFNDVKDTLFKFKEHELESELKTFRKWHNSHVIQKNNFIQENKHHLNRKVLKNNLKLMKLLFKK